MVFRVESLGVEGFRVLGYRYRGLGAWGLGGGGGVRVSGFKFRISGSGLRFRDFFGLSQGT